MVLRLNPRATQRPTIAIGLVNNFSDAGLEAGERQIVDVLRAAHDGPIDLHLFTLPGIARGQAAEARLASAYTPFQALFRTRLDGLFVTGCEPQAADLRDEAFWPALTEVIDWAGEQTASAIWSCLAAHAAVLHGDGIPRRRLAEKCTGLFAVERASAHPLLAGMKGRTMVVPHSRYNDVSERALTAAGYTILTRHREIGVDMFLRRRRSLFLHLQGHPEYDGGALGREYRRDTARFDTGLQGPPPRPRHYFETDGDRGVDRLKTEAADFAVTLFRNWLTHLTADLAVHAQ